MRRSSRDRLRGVVAVVASLLAFSASASGQSPRVSNLIPAEASVRAHMSLLASDALNGRGSGTRDEWIAATYVASQLQRLGIEPIGDNGTHIQEVPTTRAELLDATLRTGDVTIELGRGLRVQSAGSANATGPLVRYAAGIPVPQGAVVLVIGPTGPTPAESAQAAVVISLEEPAIARPVPSTATPAVVMATTPRPWRVAVDAPSFAALNRIATGSLMSLDARTRPGRTWNVLGRLTGSSRIRSSDVVLLSAHLDHLGQRGTDGDTILNGADDNASGVTCVLELAEALSRGPRPQRTVVFAWFGSEETGGAGSRYFADHPPVPLARIVANLNFEMIGRPDDRVPSGTLWMTGYERSNLGARLTERGAKIVADPHHDQGFFVRSDNYQLALRGVVAHTISSYGLHKDYHTPGDDLSRIDFRHMTAAIRSLVEPVRWLAGSSFTPRFHPGMQPVARPR